MKVMIIMDIKILMNDIMGNKKSNNKINKTDNNNNGLYCIQK